MKTFIFIFIFSISILCSCTRSILKKESNEDLLRSAIVSNIKIPFYADTLIYFPEPTGSCCLNSPKRWNHRYFTPRLKYSPYKEILLSKFQGTVLFADRNENFYKEEFDTSRVQTKVFMEITGFIYRKNKIEISEVYYYTNKSYFIRKLYSFKNDKWSYIISDEGKKQLQ